MAVEFIYEQAPFPSCHASTILEVAPGQLLAAWFGGTDEGEADVAIWLTRHDGRWSAPEKVAEAAGVPCWNPVLFRERATGEVTLFYKAGPSPQSWSGFYRRSGDGGATFGDSYLLPAGLLGPIKNKPVQLDDGAILAPSSVESYQAWGCWMERSTDGGRTWTKHGPISHPDHPHGVIQPAILRRADGSLLALMRSRGVGQVCSSESRDSGLTWSPAATVEMLPNPNSGIDAVPMADGRQALVGNPTHLARTPLTLSLSEDDGVTWHIAKVLEDAPGEYSYPAIIQSVDGTLHITYTWRRERIRHQWFGLEELA